jgi:hypothetical protein
MAQIQIKNFWSKVSQQGFDKCWPWTGSKNEHGYGGVRINDSMYKAPRIAWYLTYKRDPAPYEILHKCDNPACVNPHHLFLGTHKHNGEDMKLKGRSTFGEKDAMAKLTATQVLEIRAKYIPNVVSLSMLAREYGMSVRGIHCIVRRERWTHI